MNPRRPSHPLRNPVLIGALVVLVIVVAVVLAYNANSGLPFVPTYDVDAVVPDAAGLIPGDGVLIGGQRVGYIGRITASKTAGGRDVAVLHLRLQRSIGRLPADSTDLVRPVSPLGLKYLQITRGSSPQLLAGGSTIPISRTHEPVEIDDLFDMFDSPTRRAERIGLDNVGDGFAGRGLDLNVTLARIKPLVDHAIPVLDTLLGPRARFDRLFPSLEQAAAEVTPVAQADADLFAGLDETFTPLSEQPQALRATIVGGPPALRTATRELPRQARFVDDTSDLFDDLRPTFSSLGRASEQFGPAEATGVPALERAPALNHRLTTTLGAFQAFADDDRTLPGLQILTQTAGLLRAPLAQIVPAQTQCNYLTLFFANLENSLSESDSVGSMLNVLAVTLPQASNSEAGPASGPANGPVDAKLSGTPIQKSNEQGSFLHSDPYPETGLPGQNATCSAGNEVYQPQRVVVGTPSRLGSKQSVNTKRVLP